jgi:cobalt/nickel transport system permease protein
VVALADSFHVLAPALVIAALGAPHPAPGAVGAALAAVGVQQVVDALVSVGREGLGRAIAVVEMLRAMAWVAAVDLLLTPLGLLAPGGAFGEDAPQDLNLGELGLSAVPEGLNRYNGFWSHTVLGGYGFADGENATLAYWLSAVVGIAVIGLVIWLIALVVRRVARSRGDGDAQPAPAAGREVPTP